MRDCTSTAPRDCQLHEQSTGEGTHTLKPGFIAVAAYKSPMILSRVPAAGKYAKKEGCCQCMTPGRMRFWKSFAMSSISSPFVGGASKTQKVNVSYDRRGRGDPYQEEPSAGSLVPHLA